MKSRVSPDHSPRRVAGSKLWASGARPGIWTIPLRHKGLRRLVHKVRPEGVVAQIRAVFLALALAGLVGVLAQERPGTPIGSWAVPAALAGAAALAFTWVRVYRRGLPWWADIAEPLALAAVGTGLKVPSAMFGVFFPALMFGWLSGGSVRAAVRGAFYLGAIAFVAWMHPSSDPSQSVAHLVGAIAFAVPITLLSTRALAWVLAKHEILVGRERDLVATMEHRATYDGLTELANRHQVMAVLEELTGSHPTGGAVLMIDLDDFKVVNDAFGHNAGDSLLRAVAERLAAATVPGEVLGRLGGDEFAMISPGVSGAAEAREAAGRVLAALGEPFESNGTHLRVGASVGAALVAPTLSPGDLLRQADTAMYAAKRRGGRQSAVFEEDMHRAATERQSAQSDLAQALPRGELVLYYQPVVDLASGNIVALEALLRWRHPRLGLLTPEAFLDIAETTGRLAAIESWVLSQACADAALWPADGAAAPLLVGVNLSAARLQDPLVIADMTNSMEAAGLPPQRLVIEVTESGVIQNLNHAQGVLSELRVLGIKVSLDDFGAGYSSLGRLVSIPLDSVKLDRSLLLQGMKRAGLLKSVVDMVHSLDLRCVGEGVENREQLDQLRWAGCDMAQGFALGRPLANDRTTAMLLVRPHRW